MLFLNNRNVFVVVGRFLRRPKAFSAPEPSSEEAGVHKTLERDTAGIGDPSTRDIPYHRAACSTYKEKVRR